MNIHEKINKRRKEKLNLLYKEIEEINKIIDEKEDLFLKKYETNDFIPAVEELQQLPSDEEYNKKR